MNLHRLNPLVLFVITIVLSFSMVSHDVSVATVAPESSLSPLDDATSASYCVDLGADNDIGCDSPHCNDNHGDDSVDIAYGHYQLQSNHHASNRSIRMVGRRGPPAFRPPRTHS